jgi:hypothetical protein
MSATRRWLIERPRPVPPYARVVDASACVNGSKIARCLSGEIPMPVSRTVTSSSTSSSPTERVPTSIMTSPRSVNLIELPIKLVIT